MRLCFWRKKSAPKKWTPDGMLFEGADIFTGGDVFITGVGQILGNTHPPDACKGRACVIHNPSNHSMRSFPTLFRYDRYLMERICPHGVGHPDPDDLAFKVMQGKKHEGIHGCDGCCRGDCTGCGNWPPDCECLRGEL